MNASVYEAAMGLLPLMNKESEYAQSKSSGSL